MLILNSLDLNGIEIVESTFSTHSIVVAEYLFNVYVGSRLCLEFFGFYCRTECFLFHGRFMVDDNYLKMLLEEISLLSSSLKRSL